jgi:hypothetical protein
VRYVWDRDRQAFVDRYGRPMETPDRICAPLICSDIKPYMSPLGTGEISSRSKRRYELDKSNCRAVDPSEFRPTFKNEKFARKHGLPFEG